MSLLIEVSERIQYVIVLILQRALPRLKHKPIPPPTQTPVVVVLIPEQKDRQPAVTSKLAEPFYHHMGFGIAEA